MKKKSSWVKRLGVYPIRLKKNINSKPSRYRSLRRAVIDCDGDGAVDIVWRTLINQTQGLSADLRGRTNPEGVRQSSADSELKRGYRSRRSKKGGEGAWRFLHKKYINLTSVSGLSSYKFRFFDSAEAAAHAAEGEVCRKLGRSLNTMS